MARVHAGNLNNSCRKLTSELGIMAEMCYCVYSKSVSRLLVKEWKLMAYQGNAAVLGKKMITEHFNETLHC